MEYWVEKPREGSPTSLRTGGFPIPVWKDRNNFEVYSNVQIVTPSGKADQEQHHYLRHDSK